MNISKLRANIYVLFATFLVAGSFIASINLATVVNPISLTFLRFIGAILILLPLILSKAEYRNKVFSTIPRAMIISLFYSLYFMGMFEALKTTTALNTATLYTLVPLFTAILAFFIFKDHISFNKFIVYIVGLIGTIWVIFKADISLLINFSLNSGDYIFILGSISMCFYSISLKFLYKEGDIPIVIVFCTLIGGAIWMGLGLFIFNKSLDWNLIQGRLLYDMLYLIIGATILTVYFYQKSTVVLGPSKVMSYIYLNPVAVAILLLFIDNKAIELAVVPGIIISTIATFLLQRDKKVKV
ncbi:EamA family transporter [Malaciobacter molluscorum LMG 25693]|uniref:EamA family transporter n=1 Tax=Malaciobacter molluscorum LMG 25693 TaxID=870501 RepID=A0A2G1DEV5_9BACT|nr:DMT family transporter [Malaciobacter molluscorum]AXX92799.1 EamA/RhaT family transporter [Malaciobacter molluscorum LMG 25693]PHO17009.1 EamA family transporter [Malaciobacter molluscorum LMG 25693]RXJ96126.1 EamA family transporter [Malaciobacter molluscorum]